MSWIEPSDFLTSEIISASQASALELLDQVAVDLHELTERVSRLKRFETWGSMHS